MVMNYETLAKNKTATDFTDYTEINRKIMVINYEYVARNKKNKSVLSVKSVAKI